MNNLTVEALIQTGERKRVVKLKWQITLEEYKAKYCCDVVQIVFDRLQELDKYKLIQITMYWEKPLKYE